MNYSISLENRFNLNFIGKLLFIFLCFKTICFADLKATVNDVVDGDTLRVFIEGKSTRVRLIGIDAPEKVVNDKLIRDITRTKDKMKPTIDAGNAARSHMRSLISRNEPVRIEFDQDRYDKYDRMLAYVYRSDGSMLNEEMVEDGYAGLLTVEPNTRYRQRLRKAFEKARSDRRGLWQEEIHLSNR